MLRPLRAHCSLRTLALLAHLAARTVQRVYLRLVRAKSLEILSGVLEVPAAEFEWAPPGCDSQYQIIIRSVVDALAPYMHASVFREWRAGLFHVEVEARSVAHGVQRFLSEAFYICTILVAKSALTPYVKESAFGVLPATTPMAPTDATLAHVQRLIRCNAKLRNSYLADVDWERVKRELPADFPIPGMLPDQTPADDDGDTHDGDAHNGVDAVENDDLTGVAEHAALLLGMAAARG